MKPEVYNRIGYALISIFVVLYFVVPTARFDYSLLRIELGRVNWSSILPLSWSLSFYLFDGVLFASIAFPFTILGVIPKFFERENSSLYRRRYLWTLLALLAIYPVEFLFVFLLWGSLPLDVDPQHYIHIRIIPFWPWPQRAFPEF